MACKDAKRLMASGVREKAEQLLELLAVDPFTRPPPLEKPVGGLAGTYSRRINVQHRLFYEVIEEPRVVKVLRTWTRYEREGSEDRVGVLLKARFLTPLRSE